MLYGAAEVPALAVSLANPVLGSEPRLETWQGEAPVVRSRSGSIELAEDGTLLAGSTSRPLGQDVEGATFDLYRELLASTAERGYPGLLRLWNYLPGINRIEAGEELYWHFNAGRARAFAGHYGSEMERRYCASSAVGGRGDELVTYFLAAREEGHHIENPRQVSAWCYPPSYGPVSPTFARATVAPPALGSALFLSGTASIVGHQTRHAGDLLAQLEETLVNIEAVLAAAAPWRPRPDRLEDLDALKVYLRHPEDLSVVQAALERRLPDGKEVLYLEAEICRPDLAIEIEGIAL
ncbi:MAG TPA: hypothetical protein VF017_12550 [Thermoanaerobaculia bacterium]|nr:hypothetical protein [Thermoanaerobaculia bacterium]